MIKLVLVRLAEGVLKLIVAWRRREVREDDVVGWQSRTCGAAILAHPPIPQTPTVILAGPAPYPDTGAGASADGTSIQNPGTKGRGAS